MNYLYAIFSSQKQGIQIIYIMENVCKVLFGHIFRYST